MTRPLASKTVRALIRRIGVSKVARELAITREAVSKWNRIPAEHVVVLEPLFVPMGYDRYRLRPEIFGQAPANAIDEGQGSKAA